MAEHDVVDKAAIIRELELQYPHLARLSARTPSASWCDECQAFQIMETLEDGTVECISCRLRSELQPPLLAELDEEA